MIREVFSAFFSQARRLFAREALASQIASSKSNTSRGRALRDRPLEEGRAELDRLALDDHEVEVAKAKQVAPALPDSPRADPGLAGELAAAVHHAVLVRMDERREGGRQAVLGQERHVLLEAEALTRHPPGRMHRREQDLPAGGLRHPSSQTGGRPLVSSISPNSSPFRGPTFLAQAAIRSSPSWSATGSSEPKTRLALLWSA